MRKKILQIATVLFSVSLASSYIYFASRPSSIRLPKTEVAKVVENTKSDNGNVATAIETTENGAADSHSGPTFQSNLAAIPSTKSFIVPSIPIVPEILDRLNYTATERTIIEALRERTKLSCKEESLDSLLLSLSRRFKIPITIDKESLAKQSISINELVTIDLPEMSLREILRLILKPRELTYVVEGNSLQIVAIDDRMIMGTKSSILDMSTFSNSDSSPPVVTYPNQLPKAESK